MHEFLTFILTGSFGILTAVPVYLFLILLPAVFFFNLIQRLLLESGLFQRLSFYIGDFLAEVGLSVSSFLSIFMGFGCVTAALSSLADRKKRERIIGSTILCIAVPCSAQVAIIVSMFFLLNLHYILFFFAFIMLITLLLVFFLGKFVPGEKPLSSATPNKGVLRKPNFSACILASLKYAASFILHTAPTFVIASIIISILMFTGIFTIICNALAPYTCTFLNLPEDASSLFLLSLIKRDLGAAAMLAIVKAGVFSMAHITICLIMLTFFVPCFASLAVLFNKEGASATILIWVGSLAIASAAGKIASLILL